MNKNTTHSVTKTQSNTKSSILFDIFCILTASLLFTFSSRICFPLFFTPVPLSMQTLASFLIGGYLGKNRGACAIFLVLVEGAMGFPVFTQGQGVLYLFGPTGGYLLGFLVAAYIVGWFVEKGWNRSFLTMLFAVFIADTCLKALGSLWLGTIVGYGNAIAMGFCPFIIGSIFKIPLAAGILRCVRKKNLLMRS